MSHTRIYDNPKGKWFRAGQYPPLSLTGSFGTYVSGAAFEGRLQIINGVGDCAVALTSSTNLPNGYTLSVDNATDEVVLRWPAYQVLSLLDPLIPNADFEDGDVDWIKGAGWQIGTQAGNEVFDGTQSAKFAEGVRGNSRLRSAQPRACVPGVIVTASCQIQQGASDKGHAGGWVLASFLDAAGAVLQEAAGNAVTSGSNSEWHASTAIATAPTGTAFAVIGAEAFRKKQNYPLWFDAFAWDLEPAVGEFVGTNGALDISLCVRVTDSAGRTADWCGVITTTPILTAYFDGTGDALTAPFTPPIIATGDFTLLAKVARGTNEAGGIISGRNYNIRGWALQWEVDGRLAFRMTMNTGSGIDTFGLATAASVLPLNQLTLVGVTREGDAFKLWVGGTVVDSDTHAGYIDEPSVTQLAIGTSFAGIGENTLAGYIDWLALNIGACVYTGVAFASAADVPGADVALDFNEAVGATTFVDTGTLGLTWTRSGNVEIVEYPY